MLLGFISSALLVFGAIALWFTAWAEKRLLSPVDEIPAVPLVDA